MNLDFEMWNVIMSIQRRTTKQVKVGSLVIGSGAPVSVQSMLNAEAHDIAGNVRQAKALEAAGCQIIRAAVPDLDAVETESTLELISLSK